MKTRRSFLAMVIIVSLVILAGILSPGNAPALEHRHAAQGETVINGAINCDTNPQTPAPSCYFIPYTPYLIDDMQP